MQPQTYTDDQLLSLLHTNNESAYTEIFNRYWKAMFVTANNILQNKDAAQDIVQEVFTSLWQRRHETDISSLKSYLYQATRFQVFKAIRAEKNDTAFYSRLNTVTNEILSQDPILFKELEYLIADTINSLPDDQREIFILNRTEGLTYAQIAEKKGISVKTVEKKMSLALKHLRLNLDEALVLFMVIKRFL